MRAWLAKTSRDKPRHLLCQSDNRRRLCNAESSYQNLRQGPSQHRAVLSRPLGTPCSGKIAQADSHVTHRREIDGSPDRSKSSHPTSKRSQHTLDAFRTPLVYLAKEARLAQAAGSKHRDAVAASRPPVPVVEPPGRTLDGGFHRLGPWLHPYHDRKVSDLTNTKSLAPLNAEAPGRHIRHDKAIASNDSGNGRVRL